MTRDEILEAAAQIFSQKGFHATSMQDIAQAVNLQKASLYHHISSKQELLVGVLDLALELVIANMQAVIERPSLPDEKLRESMVVYLKTMLDNRELAAVLLLEYRSLNPELHDHHIRRRDQFELLWRDLIHEGLDKGIFTCQEPAIVARALLGVMNWTITWYRPDGRLQAEEIADQFADLFLCGLLTRPVSEVL